MKHCIPDLVNVKFWRENSNHLTLEFNCAIFKFYENIVVDLIVYWVLSSDMSNHRRSLEFLWFPVNRRAPRNISIILQQFPIG